MIIEIELGAPLVRLAMGRSQNGEPYSYALALVRLHTQPIGHIELALGAQGLSADELAGQIWAALGEQINRHLSADGMAPVSALTAGGLAAEDTPQCLADRAAGLARAPFASVAIATKDRPEAAVRCVRQLLDMEYPHFEVVIVDNAPRSSATFEAIRQDFGHLPNVRYVREDRAGLAWARNCGWRAAKGEIVAFTDDDVRVDRYWLAELVRGFEAAEQVGCVSGLILPLELETQEQLWLEQYGGFSKGFERRIFDLDRHRSPDPLYPYTAGQFGSGANMAFRRSVLQAVPVFDDALGTGTPARGGEDLAAAFQVIMAGYRLVYMPTALLYHPHHRQYAQLCRQMYGYGAGLSAFLTKCVLDDPRRLFSLAGKAIQGLHYVLDPRSPKNRRKRADYPRELSWLELRGMVYGPFGYLRSRRRARRLRRGLVQGQRLESTGNG